MAYILENTLRRSVFISVDGETKVLPPRGKLLANALPDPVPVGVLFNADSVSPVSAPAPAPTPESPAEKPAKKARTDKPAHNNETGSITPAEKNQE